MICKHPKHVEDGACSDYDVSCSEFCECCLDPFSVETNKMAARVKELEEECELWKRAAHTLCYEHYYHQQDPQARQNSLNAMKLAETCRVQNINTQFDNPIKKSLIKDLQEEVRFLSGQREKLGLSRGVLYELMHLIKDGLDKTKDDVSQPLQKMATYQCKSCELRRTCFEGAFVCKGCLSLEGERLPG